MGAHESAVDNSLETTRSSWGFHWVDFTQVARAVVEGVAADHTRARLRTAESSRGRRWLDDEAFQPSVLQNWIEHYFSKHSYQITDILITRCSLWKAPFEYQRLIGIHRNQEAEPKTENLQHNQKMFVMNALCRYLSRRWNYALKGNSWVSAVLWFHFHLYTLTTTAEVFQQ